MAVSKKALVALNDVLELPIPQESDGYISVEYGPRGADNVTASTGTIVVEISNSDGAQWLARSLTNGANADVASLAAVGIGSFQVRGAARARVRMSLAGGAQGVTVFASTGRD